MSMIWSAVWGILTVVIMLVTIKYYLPHLAKRAQALPSDSSSDSESEIENAKHFSFQNHWVVTIIMLIVCGCFAGWCGYVAGSNALSVIGMLKMTASMMVLACIFITDYELMMIPNLCPIILGIGRLILIGIEFIWNDGGALLRLFDSVAALFVSLILLLIMSKVTKGGLGMGDVKMFSALGFLCGIRAVIITLIFSFILCALVSTALLIIKKKHLKDALPMGPFIWLGYGVAILLTLI